MIHLLIKGNASNQEPPKKIGQLDFSYDNVTLDLETELVE